MSEKLKRLLGSRKFWATVVACVFVVLEEFVPAFPLNADQVTTMVYALIAFILGTGIEDSGLASK